MVARVASGSLVMSVALVWFAAILVLVTLIEAALGIWVLRRGGRRLAPRLLALYLVLQPVTWGAALLTLRVESPEYTFSGFLEEMGWSSNAVVLRVVASFLGFLPATLMAF